MDEASPTNRILATNTHGEHIIATITIHSLHPVLTIPRTQHGASLHYSALHFAPCIRPGGNQYTPSHPATFAPWKTLATVTIESEIQRPIDSFATAF